MIIPDFMSLISFKAVLDVLLVAFLFYEIIAMLKGTRAVQVVIGMLVIFSAYALSSLLELETLYWIISKFYSSFIIVIIVLFQDDMRRILTQFGKSPFVSNLDETTGLSLIEEVMCAVSQLSHERLGAIIVFERSIGLEKLYDHSIQLDALVSEQLLLSIFQSFSPLHDGAVIVQKNKVNCASAHLPLSKNQNLSKKMGTRHSAAVGISEQSDAVVLVVSEETGGISIAVRGELHKVPNVEIAKKMLVQLLLSPRQVGAFSKFFEKKVFNQLNLFYLKLMKLNTKKTYSGPERRKQNVERRNSSQTDDDLLSIAYENKLASNEVRMNLRFPESISRTNSFIKAGNKVLYTDQVKSTEHQNDNNILPSKPPTPPPRDVLIGGVSINPPIAQENEEKVTNKSNGKDL